MGKVGRRISFFSISEILIYGKAVPLFSSINSIRIFLRVKNKNSINSLLEDVNFSGEAVLKIMP